LHPLVIFDTFRGIGEGLRLYATLKAEFSYPKLAFWVIYYVLHLAPLAVDLQIWALSLFAQRGFEFVNDALEKLLTTVSKICSKIVLHQKFKFKNIFTGKCTEKR
jgi:hypothetical protein